MNRTPEEQNSIPEDLAKKRRYDERKWLLLQILRQKHDTGYDEKNSELMQRFLAEIIEQTLSILLHSVDSTFGKNTQEILSSVKQSQVYKDFTPMDDEALALIIDEIEELCIKPIGVLRVFQADTNSK